MWDCRDAASTSRPVQWLLALGALLAAGVLVWWTLSGHGDLDRLSTAMLLPGLVYIAAAFAWLDWFHDVATRAEQAGRMRFHRPWWFWGWVIPGASLVLPKMMVNDIWRAADPPSPREPLPGVVQAWWVVWVAQGGRWFPYRGRTMPWIADLVTVLTAVYFTVGAVLAICTVRALTERVRVLDTMPREHAEV